MNKDSPFSYLFQPPDKISYNFLWDAEKWICVWFSSAVVCNISAGSMIINDRIELLGESLVKLLKNKITEEVETI